MKTERTILVIEDDAGYRRSIAAFLEDSGFLVLEASDSQDGLRVLQRQAPDLILTDIRMPQIDGIDLLKFVKSTYPALPVIAITGAGDEQLLAEALQLGALHCFTKPIGDLNQLVQAIDQVLRRERYDSPRP